MADLQQREYQVDGTEFLHRAGRAVLADEPGLGKTNQLLLAAEGRTLVISPAMLQDVWMSEDPRDLGEVARWRPDLLEQGLVHWAGYSSVCDRGIDSRGRRSRVLETPRPELAGPWDTVILDESHYVKERKTRWTIATQKIQTDRLYMATGTPLPNWGHEIFTTLQLLYPEAARPKQWLGSYWRWVAQWFSVTANPHNVQARDVGSLLPGWSWEDFAEGNHLQGRWLRRMRDDVLSDMPPLTQQVMKLEMEPAQAKLYKQLKKDLYAQVEETGNEIISWSKSGVWTKLLKLTTGIEVEDPEYPKYGNKISALREIMVGRNHPTLVFAMFRNAAEKAAEALRQDGHSVGVISGAYSVADRKLTAKAFRRGELDVLVGTLGTMSEGLTLTGADTCVFLERDPRPSKNEQAVRRIHRYGQTRPCLSIDLVTPNSADSAMLKLLGLKTDQQMAALTAFDLIQQLD